MIKFNGVIVGGGKNIATCTIKYDGATYDVNKTFTIKPEDLVTIGCDRTEQLLTSQNHIANYLHYREGIITVSTQSDGIAIPLIEVTRTISPDSRVDHIEATVKSLVDAQTALRGQLNQTGAQLSNAVAAITTNAAKEAQDLAEWDRILLDGNALFYIVSAETSGCLGNHRNTILGGADQATSQTCADQPIQFWKLILHRGP